MAATIGIYEWTTTGTRTAKDGGTVRMKNANDATVDLANPLVVPTTAGGLDFSFEKYLRLQIESNAASFTQLSDLEFYSDGANGWTGVDLRVKSSTAFAAPAEGTSGGWGALTDAFTYTAGAPLALSTGTYGSSAYSSTAIDEIGDFVVATMRITTASTQGTLATEQMTFAYSEI